MKPLMKIGYLITQHDSMDVPFTKCTGCHICNEITRIRKSIDPESAKNVRKSKAKPKPKKIKPKYNVSKDEIYDCIMRGMKSSDIAKRFNMPRTNIYKMFPNLSELKMEAARRNVEMFSKDVFTHEVYLQMKELNIKDEEIGRHFGKSTSTIEYWSRRWKEQKEVAEAKKNNKQQPSAQERIDSLIQENANLELKIQEKDQMIQRLKNQVAKLERNTRYKTVG